VGWDGIVSIAPCYRLDGLGIESRWGVKASAPSKTGAGAHSAYYSVGIGSFPVGKMAGG